MSKRLENAEPKKRQKHRVHNEEAVRNISLWREYHDLAVEDLFNKDRHPPDPDYVATYRGT